MKIRFNEDSDYGQDVLELIGTVTELTDLNRTYSKAEIHKILRKVTGKITFLTSSLKEARDYSYFNGCIEKETEELEQSYIIWKKLKDGESYEKVILHVVSLNNGLYSRSKLIDLFNEKKSAAFDVMCDMIWRGQLEVRSVENGGEAVYIGREAIE